MKKTLLLSSACLLLGLASCDAINIIDGDSSADGEDATSDVTETSSEEIIEEVEITAAEAEAFLNAIDKEEAEAWFDGLTTYEFYEDLGQFGFVQMQIDESIEDDLYFFMEMYTVTTEVIGTDGGDSEEIESVYHAYGLMEKNEEGGYIASSFMEAPSAIEAVEEVSEEYVATYIAQYKEGFKEMASYDTFSEYYQVPDWEEFSLVTYAMLGENLLIRGENVERGEAEEDDLYFVYQEFLINPYGYILEMDFSIGYGGETMEAKVLFIPEAEFVRYTTEDLRARFQGEE